MNEKDQKIHSPHHVSGEGHVTGDSRFVTEDIRFADLHYIKLVPSEYAHARILNIDMKNAESINGVIAVLTSKDIPGENQIGHAMKDEPLLPESEVMYVGQPVAIVVAKSQWIAEQAIKAVKIKYEELEPILSIEDALVKNALYIPERKIQRGDLEKGFALSDFVLEGFVETGSQEHFYLETQRCVAYPGDRGEIILSSATQSTAEVQEVAARVLGLRSSDVTIDVPRLGGAFGGKERTATLFSCLAALACYKTGKPVELKLTRTEDMNWTGKRHPYKAKYRVGFNKEGKILAYDVELNSNGGAYTDLSIAILERSMLHSDNAYFIPNVRIIGRACRTNLPPNTAMRGFGAPQGIFIMETVIERIAHTLNKDLIDVRLLNVYKEGETTPYGQPVYEAFGTETLNFLKKKSEYEKLLQETAEFNRTHRYKKHGIGVVPVKFGISFTSAFLNQGSALMWIYADGTISLSHGGVEMGQEVNTKVAQVAAKELGVNLNRIRIESANTKRVGNASPTAASTGSDINGNAAQIATKKLKERLKQTAISLFKEKFNSVLKISDIEIENDAVFNRNNHSEHFSFNELVHYAYMNRVDLGEHGFYKTPGVFFDRAKGEGSPFYYFAYGCGLVQVEVDILTGMYKLVKVYLVHECATPINEEVDRGQIAGAFFQGFGWCTFEEEIYDKKGRYLAVSPSTYKIPGIKDLPEVFEIEMVHLERKQSSVFGSKAIGEPPLIYGEAAFFAIKNAIEAVVGGKREAKLRMPATPEAVLLAVEELLKSTNNEIGIANAKKSEVLAN